MPHLLISVSDREGRLTKEGWERMKSAIIQLSPKRGLAALAISVEQNPSAPLVVHMLLLLFK